MSKKNKRSLVFRFASIAFLLLLATGFTSCDRGETEQVQAAIRFSDAVARNEGPRRDSMIATWKFKEYFQNQYVAADYLNWFRSFYDLKEGKFVETARADVDRDLTKELEGALIVNSPIEKTGVVRVRTPDKEKSAYFWMVKQQGEHWRIAIVTKGDMLVKFKSDE
jgi:hypothetical protein